MAQHGDSFSFCVVLLQGNETIAGSPLGKKHVRKLIAGGTERKRHATKVANPSLRLAMDRTNSANGACCDYEGHVEMK